MSKTPVLDAFVGGILPHVHFKKVLVEDATTNDGAKYKITLQMELYQNKDELLKKSWLKDIDLNFGDWYDDCMGNPAALKVTSIFDFFKLNIITVQSNRNLNLMRKSNPLVGTHPEKWDDNKSVFLHRALSNNRDPWMDPACFKKGVGDPFAKLVQKSLDLSSLIGGTQTSDYQGVDKFDKSVYEQGKIREEVYKGKVYYAIAFEHVFYWNDTYHASNEHPVNPKYTDVEPTSYDAQGQFVKTATAPNLGIAVYTSLDLAPLLGNMNKLGTGEGYADQLNMEGPIAAEVILRDGVITQTRETFVNLMGKQWSGPVHYHTEANPGAGDYKGYMTGEFHTPDQAQEKLDVAVLPNTLVHDFSDPIQQKVPDQLIQMVDGKPVLQSSDEISNIGPNYQKIEKELGVILSPLQKEAKKNLVKDNDTEYSKLYITRDRTGSAHGLFYIDLYSLLKNNSQLFPYLSVDTQFDPAVLTQIFEKCRIVDLSLKRVRLNSTYGINGYEEFEDDKSTEPAPRTLACIRDVAYKKVESTYKNGGDLQEKYFSNIGNKFTRYFVFYDYDMAAQSTGTYRYDIELKFFDGTQIWLREQLQKYMDLKTELEAYYKLSVSHVKVSFNETTTINVGTKGEKYVKNNFKPYYNSRYKTFEYQFAEQASKLFTQGVGPDDYPMGIWARASDAIVGYYSKFRRTSTYDVDIGNLNTLKLKFVKMMLPGPDVSGSPKGILICLNILGQMCSQIQKILGGVSTKKKNNSNDLQNTCTGLDVQQLPMQFYETGGSSTRSIIEEKHSWDHPNEVFWAIANKDVYIDYLSLGPNMIHTWNPTKGKFVYAEGVTAPGPGRHPLRRISTGYFRKRCKADLAKYTKYASLGGYDGSDALLSGQAPVGWAATKDGGSIAPFVSENDLSERVMMANGNGDTLDRKLYSYLTPSAIELSDPTMSNPSWSFRYSAFNPNVFEVMENGVVDTELGDIYSEPTFFDTEGLSSTLISMANYMENRDNFGHADLSNAYADASKLFTGEPGIASRRVIEREAYKSYFSKYNITIHDSTEYNRFFGWHGDKEPGALSNEPFQAPGTEVEYPFTAKDYSDTLLSSGGIFKTIASTTSMQLVTKMPPGEISLGPLEYLNPSKSYNLPNVYKLHGTWNNFNKHGQNSQFIRLPMQDMFKHPENHNAAIFFNFNMVAKIEKFVGFGKTNIGSLAVDDHWELLNGADLQSDNLFCRILFYDKKLVGNSIDSIPVLDKYFILSDYPEDSAYAIETVGGPGDIPQDPGQKNWQIFEAMNHDKLNEMMQMFEKGVLKDGVLPVVKFPGMGPDPDPSEMGTAYVKFATGQNFSDMNKQGAGTGEVPGYDPSSDGDMGGESGGGSGGPY